MSLLWISSILLFILLFLNTLAVKPGELRQLTRAQWLESSVTLALMFLFFPLLVAAAAKFFLRDQDFAFGIAVSALAPCALVNPFFARHRGADAPAALLNVILSTILCPFITVPLLGFFKFQTVFLDTHYMIWYLAALTTGPVILSLIVSATAPALAARTEDALPYANSLILAALMFIFVGTSLEKVPLRLLWERDFFILIAIFILFDFGIFNAIRRAAGLFVNPKAAETMAISLATRNFAVSASLMLFFHPKAALPSAVGLIVHVLFFQWLLVTKK